MSDRPDKQLKRNIAYLLAAAVAADDLAVFNAFPPCRRSGNPFGHMSTPFALLLWRKQCENMEEKIYKIYRDTFFLLPHYLCLIEIILRGPPNEQVECERRDERSIDRGGKRADSC